MRRTRILSRARALALLAAPILLVGPIAASSAAASGNLRVVLSVSPTSGPRGTPVTVRGKGYQSGEDVLVYLRTNRHLPNPIRILLCSSTATTSSKFRCSGDIPTSDAGRLGSHEIQAIGQTSGTVAETPFTLT
jgi:hypothetical protein